MQDAMRQPAAVIVALGDSIVAGTGLPAKHAWPALLQTLLDREHSGRFIVRNAGVPGDTAPLGLARFVKDVATHKPAVVLIAFGLNDCHLNRHGLDRWYEARVPAGPEQWLLWRAIRRRGDRWLRRAGLIKPPIPERQPVLLPRTSPAGFAAALKELVEGSRRLGARPVLLTMTPVTESTGVPLQRATYGAYNDRIRRVAGQQRVDLIELARAECGDIWTVDGIHLTAAGQAWVAGEVFGQLERADLWSSAGNQVMDRRS